MLAFLTYLALNQDPFADFRSEFAKVMLALFGIILTVSAVVVAIHLFNGERESAKKVTVWVVVAVLGIILMEVISNL